MTGFCVLVCLNVGQPHTIGVKSGRTGHFKEPQPGPVYIGPLGLAGDAIVDTDNHGGPDQAAYLYDEADAAWWAAELGRDATGPILVQKSR